MNYLLAISQAVKEIYDIVPARDWKERETRMNKIVFIGNPQLKQSFI